jgi:Fe-S-cluster-containing dehydrogenase component
MSIDRRDFLKSITGAASAFLVNSGTAHASKEKPSFSDHLGVLIDTTLCIGCRNCEEACNKINTDLPRRLSEHYKDQSVFDRRRRMDGSTYTVVNRYPNSSKDKKPVYAKFQCMHCLEPACVSACIVGAFSKDPSGAVNYDPWKCIGCRYCMAACPFQVPAYEYDNAFTPEVRKCTFCFTQRTSKGEVPACVQSCPMQVMTFGKRDHLIKLAHKRIEQYPDRYVPHLYGEHEVGGTAWMYLSSTPFCQIDLPELGTKSIPQHTEPIQHAIFKYFIPPFALYAALGAIMWSTRSEKAKLIVDNKGDDE